MAKGFNISDILGGSTQTAAPAGQMMRVVMLPAADIEPNPDNAIYEIGDVSMLKADIADRGLRSPLEVLPAKGGKYMLIAGHRRWTACRALSADGVSGFDLLPCVIRESHGADDDLIALITSNATARELTDGERLRQYKALKEALERKKTAGELTGRVRDEMSRITGDGTGTLGRFNAIINNCIHEVVEMVENGEISMTRAYECSKLYKVQQLSYARNGYSVMPSLPKDVREDAIHYIVDVMLADQLQKLDYIEHSEWNYADHGLDLKKMETETCLPLRGSIVSIKALDWLRIDVQQLDPADTAEVIAESTISHSDMYSYARRRYIDQDALEKQKKAEKSKRAAERARADEAEKWTALARKELADFDNWPLVTRVKDISLTVRSRAMSDGGKLYVAVDELYKNRQPGKIPYSSYWSCRYDAEGNRTGRTGRKSDVSYFCQWGADLALELYIADDLQAEAHRRSKK